VAQAEAGDLEARRARLGGRLAELQRQIDQGHANLALLPADMIAGVVAQIRAWQDEHERTGRELAALAAARQEGPGLADHVEQALAQLQGLQQSVAETDPAQVRAALRAMIRKVTLHFTHDPTRRRGGGLRTTLARWEVELRPELVALLGTASPTPQRTIILRGQPAA